MNGPYRRRRLSWLLGLLLMVVVGVTAYNVGLSRGLAEQVAGRPVAFYPWHPWGFGFGFFIPLLFAFLLLRFAFWGGWRRGWYGAYGGYGGYPGGYGRGYCRPHGYGVPPAFDEWHRRAHERERGESQGPATTV